MNIDGSNDDGMSVSENEYKKAIIDSNYSNETVAAYFLWLTRNLEGIGGGPPAMLATLQFEDAVEDETKDRKEAFGEAYAFLQGICPFEERQ